MVIRSWSYRVASCGYTYPKECMVMYPTADELVAEISDTNNSWESRLDYDLVQEILGHDLSLAEWEQMIETLDDVVFETVMSFQR